MPYHNGCLQYYRTHRPNEHSEKHVDIPASAGLPGVAVNKLIQFEYGELVSKTAADYDAAGALALAALVNNDSGAKVCHPKVSPPYCTFFCRLMHISNSIDGAHNISRYSHREAFFGMGPTTPISDAEWTTVPMGSYYTLGNGVVFVGGSRYKRVRGKHGVAIRAEGLVNVGLRRPRDSTAQTVDPAESYSAMVIHVLPSFAKEPFTIVNYVEGTLIGLHLYLMDGSYLDNDMCIHGPFRYKNQLFDSTHLLHADGVLARIIPPSQPQYVLDKGFVPPTSTYRELCLDRHCNPVAHLPYDMTTHLPRQHPALPHMAPMTLLKSIHYAGCFAGAQNMPRYPSDPPLVSVNTDARPGFDCFGYHGTAAPAGVGKALRICELYLGDVARESLRITWVGDEGRCGHCGAQKRVEAMKVCRTCRVVR
ncbi:hypothetical protein HK101_006270 [Irineochytrium annulatum]|nr:hypothetical protein HK101_006270 [Irineochytrium annulatum]